jgi:hypothetical protein
MQIIYFWRLAAKPPWSPNFMTLRKPFNGAQTNTMSKNFMDFTPKGLLFYLCSIYRPIRKTFQDVNMPKNT